MLQDEVDKNGFVFLKPCIVSRGMYCGRNILAKNAAQEDRDDRGYYPVERWLGNSAWMVVWFCLAKVVSP